MTKVTLAAVAVEAILTFESGPQFIYDAKVIIPCAGALTEDEMLGLETDVVVQILGQAPTDAPFDELVKISLCYDSRYADTANRLLSTVDPEAYAVVDQRTDFFARNQAKYYFQPDQRDDYEQAIVDRLGIASKTKLHNEAAAA